MKLSIEGSALELDMLDAGQNAMASAAFGRLAAEMRRLQKKPPVEAAEGMRRQCLAIFACFDEIFGEGTAGRLFGGRCQVRRALRAFEKLSRAAIRQQEAFTAEMARAMECYAPKRVERDGAAD